MRLQVFGIGCPDCDRLAEHTAAALRALNVETEVVRVKDVRAIALFGIMLPPALGIDGEIVVEGHVPTAEQLTELLRTRLEA